MTAWPLVDWCCGGQSDKYFADVTDATIIVFVADRLIMPGYHQLDGRHPRLSFELDTFTQRQPPHYVVDSDYRRRKSSDTGIRRMLVGTAVAAQVMAGNIASSLLAHPQGYPELSLFDCHSCHHSLDDLRWEARPSKAGLKPGSVRLNDGMFLVLSALLSAIDSKSEAELLAAIKSLHVASENSVNDVRLAAAKIQQIAQRAELRFEQTTFRPSQLHSMVAAIVELAIAGELNDFIAAEHAVMSLDSLRQEIEPSPQLDRLLEQAYSALSNENNYSAERLRSAMKGYRRHRRK